MVVTTLHPFTPKFKFKDTEILEWKEDWIYLRKDPVKILSAYLKSSSYPSPKVPVDIYHLRKVNIVNPLCMLDIRDKLRPLPGDSEHPQWSNSQNGGLYKTSDKWSFDLSHFMLAGQKELKPMGISEMNIPSSNPLSVPFANGGRDIMAGRDKRKSLHCLLPTELIHQNRNHILRKIMETSVTIIYLGKCKIDDYNSQTHLVLWFYPAQDRWTLAVDVVSLKMCNSNCRCLPFHGLIRTNQYSPRYWVWSY